MWKSLCCWQPQLSQAKDCVVLFAPVALIFQRSACNAGCAGVGTGGNLCGTARYLKEMNPAVKVGK